MSIPLVQAANNIRETVDHSIAMQRGQNQNTSHDKVQNVASSLPVQASRTANKSMANERAKDISKSTQTAVLASAGHVDAESQKSSRKSKREDFSKDEQEKRQAKKQKNNAPSLLAQGDAKRAHSNPSRPAATAAAQASTRPVQEQLDRNKAETRKNAVTPAKPAVQTHTTPASASIHSTVPTLAPKPKDLNPTKMSERPATSQIVDLTKSINLSTLSTSTVNVSSPSPVFSAPIGLAVPPASIHTPAPIGNVQPPVFSAPIGLAIPPAPILQAVPNVNVQPPVFSAPIGLAIPPAPILQAVPNVNVQPPVFSAPIGLAVPPASLLQPVPHAAPLRRESLRKDVAQRRQNQKQQSELNRQNAAAAFRASVSSSVPSSTKVGITSKVKSVDKKSGSCCSGIARFITVALTISGIAAIITGVVLNLPVVIGVGAAVAIVSLPIFAILQWRASRRQQLNESMMRLAAAT